MYKKTLYLVFSGTLLGRWPKCYIQTDHWLDKLLVWVLGVGTIYLCIIIIHNIGLWVGSAALAHIHLPGQAEVTSTKLNLSSPNQPPLLVFKAIERGGSRDGRAASAYLEKADCQQLRSDTCPAFSLVSRPAAGLSLVESAISWCGREWAELPGDFNASSPPSGAPQGSKQLSALRLGQLQRDCPNPKTIIWQWRKGVWQSWERVKVWGGGAVGWWSVGMKRWPSGSGALVGAHTISWAEPLWAINSESECGRKSGCFLGREKRGGEVGGEGRRMVNAS